MAGLSRAYGSRGKAPQAHSANGTGWKATHHQRVLRPVRLFLDSRYVCAVDASQTRLFFLPVTGLRQVQLKLPPDSASLTLVNFPVQSRYRPAGTLKASAVGVQSLDHLAAITSSPMMLMAILIGIPVSCETHASPPYVPSISIMDMFSSSIAVSAGSFVVSIPNV